MEQTRSELSFNESLEGEGPHSQHLPSSWVGLCRRYQLQVIIGRIDGGKCENFQWKLRDSKKFSIYENHQLHKCLQCFVRTWGCSQDFQENVKLKSFPFVDRRMISLLLSLSIRWPENTSLSLSIWRQEITVTFTFHSVTGDQCYFHFPFGDRGALLPGGVGFSRWCCSWDRSH